MEDGESDVADEEKSSQQEEEDDEGSGSALSEAESRDCYEDSLMGVGSANLARTQKRLMMSG